MSGIIQVSLCILLAMVSTTTTTRPDSNYDVLDNGPGCIDQNAITSPEECKTAAASLGFKDDEIQTGSWSHAPPGCHVGHPKDGWSYVYFSTVAVGTTGRDVYKSICHKGPRDPCDGDWSEYYGHCDTYYNPTKCSYLVCTNHGYHYAKQIDCARDCKGAGGKLASIHSLEENNFILSLLPVHSDGEKKAWIGARRQSFGGYWYWSDRSPMRYDNWGEGEPDGYYECAAMAGYRGGTVGGWWNWYCDAGPKASYPKDCVCKKYEEGRKY